MNKGNRWETKRTSRNYKRTMKSTWNNLFISLSCFMTSRCSRVVSSTLKDRSSRSIVSSYRQVFQYDEILDDIKEDLRCHKCYPTQVCYTWRCHNDSCEDGPWTVSWTRWYDMWLNPGLSGDPNYHKPFLWGSHGVSLYFSFKLMSCAVPACL